MVYSILDCFMISFLCGMVFGVVYELFRIIRRVFPFFIVIFICDVCFFVTAAFFVFNLSLYLGNYIRAYTILGFGSGIFAYIQTLGRLVSKLEKAIGIVLRRTIGALFSKIASVIKNSIGAFAHKAAGQFGKINDFFALNVKKAISLLHFRHQKLYNKKRNITTSIDENTNGETFGGKNVINAKVYRGK